MHPKHPILYVLLMVLLSSCGVKKSLNDRPDISKYKTTVAEREVINDSTFVVGNNFLTKNKQGLWELYVEGNPYQRGLAIGSLSHELMYRQEQVQSETLQAYPRRI